MCTQKIRALSYIGAEKITFPPKPDIQTYRQTDIKVYRVASLLKIYCKQKVAVPSQYFSSKCPQRHGGAQPLFFFNLLINIFLHCFFSRRLGMDWRWEMYAFPHFLHPLNSIALTGIFTPRVSRVICLSIARSFYCQIPQYFNILIWKLSIQKKFWGVYFSSKKKFSLQFNYFLA